MKTLVLFAVCLGFSAMASQEAPESQPVNVSVQEKLNLAEITRGLVVRDMGEAAWKSFVSKNRHRCDEWCREFDTNNAKHFLDDKLLALAPSVTSGKGSNLREFCKWMALYDEFGEPLPHYISDISDSDKQWIVQEIKDFDWDRAARRVKEKARE